MRRLLLAMLGSLALFSCAAGRVRAEAALALQCPEADVTVVEKKPGTWLGSGCDKTTMCSLSSSEGSEPSCVTGIPNETPAKK
jgi:hypothetical protein